MKKQLLLQSLKQKGFSDKIVTAFSKVKREHFISKEFWDQTYEDIALPTKENQTISQPSTIALMFSLLDLKKGQKILEIGSGCGYALALLAEIVGKKGNVFGIERIKALADFSKKVLEPFKNIKVYNRDGSLGLSKEAPFDRILMSAGCEEIPEKLFSQLKEGGMIVAPVGSRGEQSLIALKKIKGEFIIKEKIPGFVFVPFIQSLSAKA